MKYLIFSPIHSLIKIQNENFEIDENSYLELDNPENLLVYPLEKHYLPTILQLKKESNKNTFGNYTIYKVEFQTVHSGENFLIKNINGKFASLSGKPYVFTVSDNSNSKSFKILYNIENPEIISINGVFALQGTLNDSDYLLIYVNDSFTEIIGEVQIEKNKISSIINCFNIAKHGKKLDLEINTNKAKIISDELLYLKNKPQIPKHTGARNFAFLEAVMCKDYNLARNFLEENLSKKLSDDHLQMFFNDFDNITAISNDEFILFKKNTPVGVFKLKNVNGKIVDVV